jgi:raffinose/stachyose/melibiose transport system permease protein
VISLGRGKGRRRLRRAVVDAILVALAAVTVGVPFWLVLVNSAKPVGETIQIGLGFPKSWALTANYGKVIHEGAFLRGLTNTTIFLLPTLAICVGLGGLVAWVLGRARALPLRAAYYVFLACFVLPPSVVTTILLLSKLHLIGTYEGVILFYTGAFLPEAIFFLTGMVKTIPVELEEAARLDGAGRGRVFLRIIFPMMAPAMASVAILVGLFVATDFYYPLFLINNASQNTMMLNLYGFVSGRYQLTNWGAVFAYIVLASAPMFICFFAAQRWVKTGLTAGAVKG